MRCRALNGLALTADSAAAAKPADGCHDVLPSNLHYSLWYYSEDRITIGLQMQEHRKDREGAIAAERIFGDVLRTIRKERSLTQEDLAFESGYHTTYIGQLERGAKNPSLRTILTLARVLNTTGSELLTRVEAGLAVESSRGYKVKR